MSKKYIDFEDRYPECKHNWIGLSPSSDNCLVNKCSLCEQCKTTWTLCDCEAWQYMPKPYLHMDGKCSVCNYYRDLDSVEFW